MTLLIALAATVLAEVQIPKLTESSGVVASRKYAGVLWTHNDSGNGPWLFALDRAGKSLGRWQVAMARANDWEDIAIGPEGLYIGDIGDNLRRRPFVTVYRVAEPDPRDKGERTAAAESFRFTYPDGPHDAEAMMIHPKTGDLYIVSKAHLGDPGTALYRAAAPLRSKGKPQVLQKVADLDMPRGLLGSVAGITGGDISPDGRRVILCDYFAAYEAELRPGWKDLKWTRIDLGSRPQGEGICYRADGKAVIATSEGKTFPLIEVQLH